MLLLHNISSALVRQLTGILHLVREFKPLIGDYYYCICDQNITIAKKEHGRNTHIFVDGPAHVEEIVCVEHR